MRRHILPAIQFASKSEILVYKWFRVLECGRNWQVQKAENRAMRTDFLSALKRSQKRENPDRYAWLATLVLATLLLLWMASEFLSWKSPAKELRPVKWPEVTLEIRSVPGV